MSKKSKKRKKGRQVISEIQTETSNAPFWEKHPYFFTAGVLLILLLIFFNQIVFLGKTLLPPDSLASRSMKPFIQETLKKGDYPLWNPYIFSGMPSYASLTSSPYTDVVETVVQASTWIFRKTLNAPEFLGIITNYLLLGFLFYILFRQKKFTHAIALFASVAIVFMPQITAYSAFGHNTKLRTAVLIPLIFLLTERLLDKKDLLSFCSLALAFGIQLLRKHIQLCYYTQLMIGTYLLYWIVLSLKDKKKVSKVLAGTGLLMGAIFLGFVLSSITNLSVWEYSKYSIRGGSEGSLDFGYATNWSFPPLEILTFLVPSFTGFGGATYWGPITMGTAFPIYFGVIILFLAGFGLILKRNRTTWFFTIFAGIVLLISFGKHFPVLYNLMFKYFPMFNKFRAPKMILVFFGFSLTLLAAYGLQGLIQLGQQKIKSDKILMRYIMTFCSIMATLLLILLFGKGTYLQWAARTGEGATSAYKLALNSALRNAVLLGFAVFFVIQSIRQKIKGKWLPLLLGVLVLIDLWIVDHRFMAIYPKSQERAFFRETSDVQFLKSQKDPFRILPVQDRRPPNWYTYHKIQNAYGYHAAKIRIYQEFMTAFGMPDQFFQKYLTIKNGRYQFQKAELVPKDQLALHKNFLKLTNVKYILCPYPLPDDQLGIVTQPRVQGENFVLEFTDQLPRVFFPQKVIQVQDKKEILSLMTSDAFDPEETAIIQEMPPFEIQYSDSNQAQVTRYENHRIEIQAHVKTPSLMILSEVYYPAGWKAYVNGEEIKIYQTDYVLRSLFLKSGVHHITMVFRPRMFGLGLIISVITFCILTLGVVFGLRQDKKHKTRLQHPEAGDSV